MTAMETLLVTVVSGILVTFVAAFITNAIGDLRDADARRSYAAFLSNWSLGERYRAGLRWLLRRVETRVASHDHRETGAPADPHWKYYFRFGPFFAWWWPVAFLYPICLTALAWGVGGPWEVAGDTMPAAPWPWVGVGVALALVAYYLFFHWLAANEARLVGSAVNALSRRLHLSLRISRIIFSVLTGIGIGAVILLAFIISDTEIGMAVFAVVGAVAVAVAVAVAGAFAGTFASVGAGAVAVAGAGAVAVAGAGAGAVAVAVAVAGAFAGAYAGAGAGVVGVGVGVGVLTSGLLVLLIDETISLTLLCFFILLPFVNLLFDWLSWGVSRWLLARVAAGARWWVAALEAGFDALAAGALLVLLAVVIPATVVGLNALGGVLVDGFTGFDWRLYLVAARADPFRAGLLATGMVATTLLPTAGHIAAAAGTFLVPIVPGHRRLAARLENSVPATQNGALCDLALSALIFLLPILVAVSAIALSVNYWQPVGDWMYEIGATALTYLADRAKDSARWTEAALGVGT